MERLKAYCVDFMVDTLHTEEIIKAHSKTDAETLLNKRYVNCAVKVLAINEITE